MREKLIELLYDAMFFEGYGRELCEQQADHLIANGVVVQEWISVKDRLPEEGKWVLMADKYGLGVEMAKVSCNCVRTRDGDVGGIDVYTHWMPMPELPKGE